jgi:hypothetical protein
VFAWRLVLLARKLCLVCITELTGKNAMFQASLSLAVLAVAYGLHAKYHPFVTSGAQATALAEHSGSRAGDVDKGAKSVQARRISRRLGRRASQVLLDLAVIGARKTLATAEVLLDFNVLETTLLCTSTAVLLGGMMFESSLLLPGSAAYVFLTVCVGGVTIGSVALFAAMVAVETRRTCRRMPVAMPQRGASAGASPGDIAAATTDAKLTQHINPLHALRNLTSRTRARDPVCEASAEPPPSPSSAVLAHPRAGRGRSAWREWTWRSEDSHAPTAFGEAGIGMLPMHTAGPAPSPITVNPLLASGGLRARVRSLDAPRSAGEGNTPDGDGAKAVGPGRGGSGVAPAGSAELMQHTPHKPLEAAHCKPVLPVPTTPNCRVPR